MKNKNLYRLAELGLQCIADSHEINSNLRNIEIAAKGNADILQYVKNIRLSMNAISFIRYQKEKSNTAVEISVLDLCEKVKKYMGSSYDINIDCKENPILTIPKLLLLQSLINLVDNALIFSEKNKDNKKGCKITIDKFSITISDNGLGVPEEIKNQIFDMYFTTKDISNQGCATGGLGLYTVKQHLDLLGFKIIVENNTILKGANFKIIF